MTSAAPPSLRRTITGAIVVASFLPMAVVLWVVHIYFNAALDFLTRSNLQYTADRHAARVEAFVRERLDSIRLLAADNGPRLLDPRRFREGLARLQDIYGDSIVDMGLVDMDGVQQVYAGPLRLERAGYAEAPWFRELRAGKEDVYVSDVFLGLRKSPHFIVAQRLTLEGKPWILRATVDFASFSRVVGEYRVGATGRACIINRQGQYQTPPLADPPMEGEALAAKARAVFGEAFGLRPADRTFNDGRYLYIMTPLQLGRWILVLRIANSDAFASLAAADRTLYLSLGLISLAVLCGGLLLSWRLLDYAERLERERAALNDHLVQAGKLSALGEMAAGIAHEINNPVAIMLEEAGWIEDVLDDMPKDGNTEEIARSVGKIRGQGTRCRSITHKLLGFARKSNEPDQPVNIADMLREMAALTDQKARNARVNISVRLPPDLPAVRATPSVLQQLLLNLFNNAVDAMEDAGGELRVEAAAMPEGMVHVRVADTGPGMSEDVRARIFDPFFTTKSVGKGTGLGLSICYGIVRGLGGSITVESALGGGTTFHVLLPAAPPEV